MGLRRPWNITNHPVYSLATYQGKQVNMNICTSVMPVSKEPRQYAIAIYRRTQTLENAMKANEVVLQYLVKEHMPLVKLLGKQSGRDINKHERLEKEGQLEIWKGYSVLRKVAALLLLEPKSIMDAGDHQLFLYKVKQSSTRSESNLLVFKDLIENNIIL
jgi:flavin reductase (DIM6/NTAB) family NADH-FMN oxidoreductase RutF